MTNDPNLPLDEFQQRWLAQDRKLDQALRINARLWQRAEMAAPRAAVSWLRAGVVFNLVLGGLCLLWTGSFIHAHIGEWQLVVPAVALHAWLVAAIATTVVELVRTRGIDYDAPIVTIQGRLESLRAFKLRALRPLFLTGVPVFTVPFLVVAFESWFGVDLTRVFGATLLLAAFATTAVFGVAVVWACGLITQRFAGAPALERLVRGLAGYNLAQAETRLADLADFQRAAP